MVVFDTLSLQSEGMDIFMGHRLTQTRPPRVAKHCGQVNADYFFTTNGTKIAKGVNWFCWVIGFVGFIGFVELLAPVEQATNIQLLHL